MKELLAPIVKANAEHFVLDENLVLALIEVESGGDTYACRYEPHWRYLLNPEGFAKRLKCSVETEVMLQSTSWGPMQLMGSNARSLGYEEWLTTLTIPSIGIGYGCRFLSRLKVRYPEERDLIAAYNAGSPRVNEDGSYKNQAYVDKVWAVLERLRSGRIAP